MIEQGVLCYVMRI